MGIEMPKVEVPQLRVKQEALALERNIRRELLKKNEDGDFTGGIYFSKEKDKEGNAVNYIYLANPYEGEGTVSKDNNGNDIKGEGNENFPVIKLKTEASAEDIARIKNDIIPTKEAHEMLMAMAETYKLKQMLLLEGPTAVGKTYLVEKFTELLRGSGVRPLDFYCSGQTDVSELMAKWVPKVKDETDKKKWHDFLESAEAQESLMELETDIAGENLSEEKKLTKIHKKLQELVAEAGLDQHVQWDFQYGSVPKAMTYEMTADGNVRFDGNNPKAGIILHIEEVGLAEPQVINALLQLRGKRGKVADGLQLWQNGGRKIKAGANFWTVFTTNPPEAEHGFLARNAIDPALARGVVYKRVGEIGQKSLELASKRFFTYTVGEDLSGSEEKFSGNEKNEAVYMGVFEKLFPIEKYPDIGKHFAKIMAGFHKQFEVAMKKGSDKGREQKIPLTMDDFARVADYINQIQLRDPETGFFDLVETAKKAIKLYYIGRIADDNFRADQNKFIEDVWESPVYDVQTDDGPVHAKEYFEMIIANAYEEERLSEFDPIILLELQSSLKDTFIVLDDIIRQFEQLANIDELKPKVQALHDRFTELMEELNNYLENFDVDMDALEENRRVQMQAQYDAMSIDEKRYLVTGVASIQEKIGQTVDELNNLGS